MLIAPTNQGMISIKDFKGIETCKNASGVTDTKFAAYCQDGSANAS